MQYTSTLLSAIALTALAVSAAPIEERTTKHSGRATWYRQDGTAGSCGSYHSDASHVIAVPEWMSNKHCGKSVTIKYGSKTTQATIQDTCPSCNGYAIDLSRGAFGALAAYSVGEMEVKWWIN